MDVSWLLRVFAFVLGSIVGSFLNVCIVRLPKGQSVVTPSSRCVHCGNPLSWYDNIPLLSYVLLRGKCRSCGRDFSARYFWVELLTAVSFLAFLERFGLTIVILPYLVMMGSFIVATFVDLEHRIIPDEITLGGLAGGIVFSAFIPRLHDISDQMLWWGRSVMTFLLVLCCLLLLLTAALQKMGHKISEEEEGEEEGGEGIFYAVILLAAGGVYLLNSLLPGMENKGWFQAALHLKSLEASLIGTLIGGGAIYAMGMAGDIIFRRESMGGGDVKLMAMIGAFLGWKLAILTFFVAPLFGAVAGIIVKIRTKESVIAYGPFIALGAVISLFLGDFIIDWIMSGYVF